MKIGTIAPLISPIATPEYLETFARVAEECGFHSIWLAEHVVLFDECDSKYPYSADGRAPAGGESGFLETFTALSYMAAMTETIRLGSGICLVPQRNPVYTAKESAAVDWLSRGRLDFGVGVGWQAEEFRALGVPFERRGARCRSYLEVIKRLWCDPVSEYRDDYYRLDPCRMYPKPIQSPHPPIYVGGESDAALERVAAIGNGWYGFNQDPEDLPPMLAKLDGFLKSHGRRREDVSLAVSPYFKGCDLAKLEGYAALGIDQVILPVLAMEIEAVRPALERLAETLVEPARRLAPGPGPG